ncbi:MAG: hypothetical protein QM703_00555 [Gemmatales bacterium]
MKNLMNILFTVLFSFVCLANVNSQEAGKQQDADRKTLNKPKITISKETTYFVEPVLRDGEIDYVEAWNRHCKQRVTPTNNAAVLLTKAFGAWDGDERLPDSFFKEIGCDPPRVTKDECYIHPWDFFKGSDEGYFNATVKNGPFYMTQQPWSRKDYPKVASWLDRNERPLRLISEATLRKRCYSPLQFLKFDEYRCLSSASRAYGYKMLQLEDAYCRRAMLHVKEKRWQQAIQDMLVAHRLARLHGPGEELTLMNDYGIECTAIRGDMELFSMHDIPLEVLQEYRQTLDGLTPLPRMHENLSLAGRCCFLDSIIMTAKHGKRFPGGIGGAATRELIEETEADQLLKNVDWDEALRATNQWFDRIAKDLNTKNDQHYMTVCGDLNLELLAKRIALPRKVEATKQQSPKERGEVVSELIMVMFGDRVKGGFDNEQRYLMYLRFRSIAYALELFRRKNGSYPSKLVELMPVYLTDIPKDLGRTSLPVYQKTEKGYRLYSIGLNGIDDKGHGLFDKPVGDDILFEMPQRFLGQSIAEDK